MIPVPRAADRSHRLVALVHLGPAATRPGAAGLATAVRYERSFFEKITPARSFPRRSPPGHRPADRAFDADDRAPDLRLDGVIRQRGIVYGTGRPFDATVAGAVGNSMLADLVSVGGKLYKTGVRAASPRGPARAPRRPATSMMVNELDRPRVRADENKMGGAGFMVHAYTQTVPRSRPASATRLAQQILGNFNNVVDDAVKSQPTAAFLVDQLPQVDVSPSP